MSLTRTAVDRPIGTAIISLAILVLGVIAVDRLAVDLLPQVDFPRISVVTRYEGVGPVEMETLLTRPIERTLATVSGVERIQSSSSEGLSRVVLRFAWGTDLEAAVNDVRAYLDRLTTSLPDDANRPLVYKFDLASVPVATLGVAGAGDPRRLRYQADELLTRRLERVPGVAAVTVRGGMVREIQVRLIASQLTALGVSGEQVAAALARDNRNVSAGDLQSAGREVLVRSIGEWQSPDEILAVTVTERDGRIITVGDVATVDDTVQRVRSEHWVDGQPGITMRVSKQTAANTATVVESLRAELDKINDEYAGRLKVVVLSNAATFVKASITNVTSSALWGAALAVLILLLFLRDFGATALIAIAIPLSIVATFALMFFSGFTLNVISFGGLALGIGMLVDNAIVILENIYRKRQQGMSGRDAAVEGAREVGPAVVAGTLTTIAVFAPVIFMGGFAGIFFGEMAAVVSFALGCSLVMALTLVPTLAARLIRRSAGERSGSGAITPSKHVKSGLVERAYTAVVRAAIRAPGLVVAMFIVLLAGSALLTDEVGAELMPETDEGLVDVDLKLPVGTPVAKTRVVVAELLERIQAVAEPGEIGSTISSAGPDNWWRPGGGHEGEVEVNLVPAGERSRDIDEILKGIQGAVAGIPDASLRVRKRSQNMLMRLMRGRSGERLVVEIRGYALDTANALSKTVADVVRSVKGVSDVRIDRSEGLGERQVRIDAARAADLGLARAEVADALETYLLGRVATKFRAGGFEFEVRVQLQETDSRELSQLMTLPIVTGSGDTVTLGAIASVTSGEGPSEIEREGQERVVAIYAGLEAGADARPLNEVADDVTAALATIERPAGFSLGLAGEQKEQDETFGGLTTGILLALLLVFAVMAVQFESLVHPAIVMTAIPFGFVGVVVTLVTTDTTFNINSFLGVIVLVGIAVNNAIVLIDYTNLLRREHGMKLVEAVVEGARTRLRPILMTTATTAFAMLPLAVGVGEGSEIQAPLARVVLGGLIMSSVVTLLLVPCLYLMAEQLRNKLTGTP